MSVKLTFRFIFIPVICFLCGIVASVYVNAQGGCTRTSYETTSGNCWNNEVVTVCGSLTCTALKDIVPMRMVRTYIGEQIQPVPIEQPTKSSFCFSSKIAYAELTRIFLSAIILIEIDFQFLYGEY